MSNIAKQIRIWYEVYGIPEGNNPVELVHWLLCNSR
jgi:hypothetical protein